MKTTNFLYDIAHANLYIHRCIIKLDDKLIYITDLSLKGSKILIYYSELPLKRDLEIKNFLLEEEAVEWNVGNLGFVNSKYNGENQVHFLSRTNRRVFKLGLHVNNMIFDENVCNCHQHFPYRSWFYDRDFINCLYGIYPKFKIPEKALAISRNFAVNYGGNLYSSFNRNNAIGKHNKLGNFFQLDEKFHYLLQLAEKDGLKCKL